MTTTVVIQKSAPYRQEKSMSSASVPGGYRPLLRQLLLIFAMALSVVGLTPAAAGPARPSEPEQVDAHIRAQMQNLRIPGMAVAVVKGGRIVLLRSYGIANVEFSVPADKNTVFAINSITKAFTGVAAMRLVEQKRLDLSAPVGTYLTDLPESWRSVTIRQLLSHMSGLPDIMRAPTVETDATAAWDWIRGRPVVFAPGERFHYCQTNYMLIQRVVNQIEGRPLDAPLAQEQMRIADMAHTAYGDAYDVVSGKAPTYRWTSTAPKIAGYSPAAPASTYVLKATSERFLPARRAASGLNSSAEDLARWIIALEGGRIVKRESLNALWAPVAFNNGTPGQWSLGWQVLQRGKHRAVGMTGGGRAAFSIYPDDDVAVVVLTNLSGSFPEDMVDKIASIYAPGLDLSGVAGLRIALDQRGYDRAAEVAAKLEADHPTLRWREAELNDWGYRLLSTGRSREALAIFQLIADKFPQSANAHDSLAQALWINGDKASAIIHYRRALELDPTMDSAKKHLEELAGQ